MPGSFPRIPTCLYKSVIRVIARFFYVVLVGIDRWHHLAVGRQWGPTDERRVCSGVRRYRYDRYDRGLALNLCKKRHGCDMVRLGLVRDGGDH